MASKVGLVQKRVWPLCLSAEAIQREGGASGKASERQDSDFVDKNIYFYKITSSLMH